MNYEFFEIRHGFFDTIYSSKLNESVCDGGKTWHSAVWQGVEEMVKERIITGAKGVNM